MGSGSVLNTDNNEEQQRIRRKLENLELELKAAELVTRKPPSEQDNLNDISHDEAVNHNTVRQQKTARRTHKREAPQPRGSSAQLEDNCIMCLQERADISDRNDSKVTAPGQKRFTANRKTVNDSKVQRSKSDAQDKAVVGDIQDLKSKHNIISSKLIKRSMSFNRIFSSSMLNRSKEYRL